MTDRSVTKQLCNCLPNECHCAPGWTCRKAAARQEIVRCAECGVRNLAENTKCGACGKPLNGPLEFTSQLPKPTLSVPMPPVQPPRETNPTSNEQAFLPCPFCGTAPKSHSYSIGGKSYAWVECDPCKIRKQFHTTGESLELQMFAMSGVTRWWNRRSVVETSPDSRDAARYRWLRQARAVYDDSGRFPQGESLDECCDAFIKNQCSPHTPVPSGREGLGTTGQSLHAVQSPEETSREPQVGDEVTLHFTSSLVKSREGWKIDRIAREEYFFLSDGHGSQISLLRGQFSLNG